MSHAIRRLAQLAALLATVAVAPPVLSQQFAQQLADSTFAPSVAKPAYQKRHPRVLFDEAHNNFHTTTGRYSPWVKLVSLDGYAVTANHAPFTAAALKRADLLVIANARGPGTTRDSFAMPAFSSDECAAVASWVRAGGALLLIADHAPFGAAADSLAERFGVGMRNSYTIDTTHTARELDNFGFIVYSRENGLLGEHPILSGRDTSERIGKVIVFTGQSLSVPPGATPLLRLIAPAEDLPVARGNPVLPAAGRAQGLAMTFGRGRVAVLGEAAMLTAQLAFHPSDDFSHWEATKFGMNVPGIDNQQFALNLMHWLTGLLPAREGRAAR